MIVITTTKDIQFKYKLDVKIQLRYPMLYVSARSIIRDVDDLDIGEGQVFDGFMMDDIQYIEEKE